MPRAVTTACIIITILLRFRSASAQERQVVVELRDGSMYQGELVEKIVGDHITLRLATGEFRTVPWSELSKDELVPVPLPPPAHVPPSNLPPADPAMASIAARLGANPDAIPWPEPDRSLLRFEGSHFVLGAGIGWQFATGVPLSLYAGWEPNGWLGLEIAGQATGNFGPGVREMVRLGLPLLLMRAGVGLGLRQNFLRRDPSNPQNAYAGAPDVAHFFDFEMFYDLPLGKSLTMRGSGGAGYLLNAGDYRKMCSSPSVGSDCWDWGIASGDPWAAASGTNFFTYMSFDFLWGFRL